MKLTVTAKIGRPFVPHLRKYLRRAVPLIPGIPAEISVALVNDKLMSELHLRDMRIAGPTDVLTYELDHDPEGCVTDGEVIICVPEARRQAKERGTRPADEVLLYALHGLLHLAGFDDRTERSYRTMHRMEDTILTRIGIGPVFRPPAIGSTGRSAVSPRPRRTPTTRAD